MPHLDERLLAELIDGELQGAEREEATRHLESCPDCRARHAEATQFASESDRLVAVIEPPRPVRTPGPRVGRRGSRVMLPWRELAWAASLVAAAGVGYYAGVPRSGESAPPLPGTPTAQSGAPDSQARMASDLPARNVTPAPAPRDEGPAAGRLELGERARPDASPAQLPQAVPAEADRRQPEPQAESTAPAKAFRRMAEDGADAAPFPSRNGAAPAPGALGLSAEAAASHLGAPLRLIEGLVPAEITVGATQVRVVYLDPPGRQIWLDQRRPGVTGEVSEGLPALIQGDTLATQLPDGQRRLDWLGPEGMRLSLSGYLGADSLKALVRRVR